MITARALKAFGPTQSKQLFLTGFLGHKLFLKLQQAKSFLLHKFAPICYLFCLIIAYWPEQKQ
jgi:hypothetical protein